MSQQSKPNTYLLMPKRKLSTEEDIRKKFKLSKQVHGEEENEYMDSMIDRTIITPLVI